MLRRSRADVRMGLDGNVRVDAHANAGHLLPFCGDGRNLGQLHLRFYVQGADICPEGLFNFVA